MIIWEVVAVVDYDVDVVADDVAVVDDVVVVAVLPLLNDVMWCLFYAGYMVVLINYLHELLLIIIECEISPLLLENVALRMSNLQVTKNSAVVSNLRRVV